MICRSADIRQAALPTRPSGHDWFKVFPDRGHLRSGVR
jgi:hypothetical protein